MKKTSLFFLRMGWVLCLTLVICFSEPLFYQGPLNQAVAKGKKDDKKDDKKNDDAKKAEEARKKARDEYKKALKEVEKGKWKEVLKHLEKALKEDSQPAADYYPLALAGLAYSQMGQIDAARKFCSAAQDAGIAPANVLGQCLQAAGLLTQEAKPEPAPTATPEPPQPAPPAQMSDAPPAQVSDAPPTITMVSKIPDTTQDAELKIAGMVSDDQGIDTFDIQVTKPDSRLLAERPKVRMVDKMFEAMLPLDVGANAVVITAIDTSGQTSKQEFLITRLDAPQQPVPDTRATTQEPPPGPNEAGQGPRNVYAVVIGIGKFQDERIPPLRFTVPDAQGFYDVLTDPNYGRVPKEHVQLLLDDEATYKGIKSAIGSWLSKNARENDTVIIYYSGHGAPENNETYWVTYDANIDDLYATAMNNNEIADMLDRVESKRVLTFLDSCYSAATVKRSNRTRDVAVEIPWDDFSGEGNVTISASNGKQLSLEMESYGHGVFTYYLLKGMQGEADGMAGTERDGVVEVEELWNFVRNSVTETAKKRGNTQTPVLQGSLTAGIPVTFDMPYLEELHQRREQEKQEKQAALQALFEQGKIDAGHFDCAFQMLEAGHSDGYLDGLLAGELSPETFSKLFECPPPSQ